MKNIIVKSLLLLGVMALTVTACNTNTEVNSGETTLTDVIQTSGQLASGSSFTLSGSSTSSSTNGPGSPHGTGGYMIPWGVSIFILRATALRSWSPILPGNLRIGWRSPMKAIRCPCMAL